MIQRRTSARLKINIKKPPRPKNVERNLIVTNSEIHLHHFEYRGFKVGRSSHRKSSTRKVFVKFRKIDRKTLESESVFLSVLRIFWEYLFYWTLPGDCFWKDLIIKKFNCVSLIFVNAQLCHAPPEWSLLFWSKKEHLLMKKT